MKNIGDLAAGYSEVARHGEESARQIAASKEQADEAIEAAAALAENIGKLAVRLGRVSDRPSSEGPSIMGIRDLLNRSNAEFRQASGYLTSNSVRIRDRPGRDFVAKVVKSAKTFEYKGEDVGQHLLDESIELLQAAEEAADMLAGMLGQRMPQYEDASHGAQHLTDQAMRRSGEF